MKSDLWCTHGARRRHSKPCAKLDCFQTGANVQQSAHMHRAQAATGTTHTTCKPAHQITPRCADKHGKHAATEQVSTTADRQVPYDGCGPLHHSLNTSGRFSCCRDNVHPTAWTRRGSRDSSPTPPTFRTNKSTTKKWLHTGAPPQPTPGGLTHIRAQKYASPLGGRHRKERHSSAAITHHPNLNPEG